MAADRYLGPWRDNPASAESAALADTKVDTGEYVRCEYSDGGFMLAPVDPAGPWEIHGEVRWSEARDQHRCILVRLPNVHGEDGA